MVSLATVAFKFAYLVANLLWLQAVLQALDVDVDDLEELKGQVVQ